MPVVKNLTNRGVSLLRWRILPNGTKAIDPSGNLANSLPAEVAYSDQAKRLADQDILEIEGYHKLIMVGRSVGKSTSLANKVLAKPAPKKVEEVKVGAKGASKSSGKKSKKD